jgi:aldehyde dehydrogenase
MTTMIGAQASSEQLEKIPSYRHRQQEGARPYRRSRAPRGDRAAVTSADGFKANKMRIFQEEIFGPVLSVTPFDTDDEALAIANDTLYGLGAGVWTRSVHKAYSMGREIQAGRVWTTAITSIRRTRRSAATSSRASAARTTR